MDIVMIKESEMQAKGQAKSKAGLTVLLNEQVWLTHDFWFACQMVLNPPSSPDLCGGRGRESRLGAGV